MKSVLIALLGLSTALGGCVVYDEPHHDGGVHHERDHDRDHDGVRNRDDRHPDNPYRN